MSEKHIRTRADILHATAVFLHGAAIADAATGTPPRRLYRESRRLGQVIEGSVYNVTLSALRNWRRANPFAWLTRNELLLYCLCTNAQLGNALPRLLANGEIEARHRSNRPRWKEYRATSI